MTDSEQTIVDLSPQWQTFLHHNNHFHTDPIDTNWTTTALVAPLGCGVETYYYSGKSSGLASSLHREVLRVMGTPDRHVRTRGFYVIRKTRIPAVLCECGFLTNPREGALISQAATRQRIADLLAQAIIAKSGR